MKKFSPTMALMPCFFGFVALFNNLGKERVAALHGADIVGIMAPGFCFGVTFSILTIWYNMRKSETRRGEGVARGEILDNNPTATSGCLRVVPAF